MPTNSRPILVVGGAGYIGSHMVMSLHRAGYQPIVLDNLSNGHRDAVVGTECIVGDMADTKLLHQLFARYNFSAVMHFASLIDITESMKLPAKYYRNNVTATLNLLDVMLHHGVKPFIFSSTAAVYGEPHYQTISINEKHPLAPINPYGRSKWMVEEIIKDYAKNDELNYTILRYFNAAGADPKGRSGERHEQESHLIPLILQVAAGKRNSMTIYGNHYPTADGTCVRDYVHVVDICNAHLLALQAMFNGKKNILCNLGTGQGYSVLQVINAARCVTGKAIPTINGGERPGDAAILVADASLAKQELQWQPAYTNLDTIIAHAWQFMQKHVF
jgi:UDP-glucose 4-epimerase